MSFKELQAEFKGNISKQELLGWKIAVSRH